MKKKTLVLGASLKSFRFSNFAINRLVNHGVEVVALGVKSGDVFGVWVDTEVKPYKDVHTVTLYLNPGNQKGYYDFIVSLSPKRVIFNPGTENPELYTILKANGICFEEACTLVLLASNQY
ncbi:CoA-binding protein [Snuella lapsa]|uniref:CoA-binding protein n=1 Tax=Snuella lapsa TaxID=870481 RepID=A0ABP6YB45_9FLAO